VGLFVLGRGRCHHLAFARGHGAPLGDPAHLGGVRDVLAPPMRVGLWPSRVPARGFSGCTVRRELSVGAPGLARFSRRAASLLPASACAAATTPSV